MSHRPITVSLLPLVQQTLDLFVGGVRSRFGPRVVSLKLFGSYARGEAHDESDIDCLVLLESVSRDDERAITDLVADLTCETGLVISPIIMSADRYEAWKGRERLVPLAIEREGIPL